MWRVVCCRAATDPGTPRSTPPRTGNSYVVHNMTTPVIGRITKLCPLDKPPCLKLVYRRFCELLRRLNLCRSRAPFMWLSRVAAVSLEICNWYRSTLSTHHKIASYSGKENYGQSCTIGKLVTVITAQLVGSSPKECLSTHKNVCRDGFGGQLPFSGEIKGLAQSSEWSVSVSVPDAVGGPLRRASFPLSVGSNMAMRWHVGDRV